MFTLFITLSVVLCSASFIAAVGGRRIASRCGMAAALVAYADALTWDHAPTWQPITLLAGTALLLLRAIVIALTRPRFTLENRETDRG